MGVTTGSVRWTDGLRLLPAVVGADRGLAPPYKLLLSLTDRCNHRCRHCGVWTRPSRPELTADQVQRLVGSLPSLRWLDLTGGEIVLRPDLDDLVGALQAVTARVIFLHFATNGLQPDRVGRLAEGLRRIDGPRLVVTVSVDGDRDLHDQMRGRRGAFDRAVETARMLHRMATVDVYVGTTLTPQNLGALPRLAAALSRELPELPLARWHMNVMNRSEHFFANADQALPEPAEVLKALDVFANLRGPGWAPFALVERIFARTLRHHLATGRAPVPCQALRASAFVDAIGDVYPCHILPERLGNVRDTGGDLSALLAGSRARAVRDHLARHSCDGCWTPCEAYHALLASPLRALRRALL